MSSTHNNIKIFIVQASIFGSGFEPASARIQEHRYRKTFLFLYICSWIRLDDGWKPEPKVLFCAVRILMLLCVTGIE
jgi:hypothetical protein